MDLFSDIVFKVVADGFVDVFLHCIIERQHDVRSINGLHFLNFHHLILIDNAVDTSDITSQIIVIACLNTVVTGKSALTNPMISEASVGYG